MTTITTTTSVHETRHELGSSSRRAGGEMLWFNNDKDFGYIASSAGERLYVHGSGFRDGARPQGRCARLPITFRVAGSGETARAEDVVFVDQAAPRRARTRRRGH